MAEGDVVVGEKTGSRKKKMPEGQKCGGKHNS